MSNYNDIDPKNQYGQQQQPQYPNQAYGQQQQGQQQWNQPQQNYNQPNYNQQQQQGGQGNYQMNQQQYPQQTYAPQQDQQVNYGAKPSEGERFNPKKVSPSARNPKHLPPLLLILTPSRTSFRRLQRVKDPIFLVLYILTVLGYAAVSGIALNAWRKEGGLGGGLGKGQGGSGVTLNASTAYLLCFVGGAAL